MLTKFSVKRPYTVIIAVILVLILGGVSFVNLQTDLLPSMDLPYMLVVTAYPGASPEEVEMVVTRPVEQIAATVNNIKNVSSVSRENTSIVILEFTNDVNMDSAFIELNGSLEMVKAAWDDSVGTPMLIRLNPDMLPVTIASLDAEGMNLAQISRLAREEIIPGLESVDGVAAVSGTGLIEEQVEVVINQEKIDKIDDRILLAIDAELAAAEKQLLAAKAEIAAGKEQLAAEKSKREAEFEQAAEQITGALEQLAVQEKNLASHVLEVKEAISDLHSQIQAAEAREQQLEAEKQAENNPVRLAEIEAELSVLAEQKAQAAAALAELEGNLDKLLQQSDYLTEQHSSLLAKREELEAGRKLFAAEIEKAESSLLSGEAGLNEQLEEFEKARREARQKSNLDNMITAEMISGILAAQNFSMPAGYTKQNGADFLVKVGDKLAGIEDIKNLFLFDTQTEEVGKIYLKDVADINYRDNAEDLYAKINGNDAVILLLQKQSNFSTTEVTRSIRKKMDELAAKYEGVSFTTLLDQGFYIDIVIDTVLDNLIYGMLLAVLVLILFLRDIKPTVMIAVSIPISVIFTIAMMYFSGITMNVIALAGLAISVGMLVDNSIVVIENIYRLRSEGLPVARAVVEGANEVFGAIFASTLTTACVFLPIVFTKGLTKQLFTDMGLTIAYSLFASLIVAVTLVPTVASLLLRRSVRKENYLSSALVRIYETVLGWSLRHKAVVIVACTALFAFSVYLAAVLGTSFMPDMDAPQMAVSIEMPKGKTSDEAIAMSETVIERISVIDDIETIGAFRSSELSGMFGGTGGGSSMSLYLVLREDRVLSSSEIETRIKELTEDLDCTISVNSGGMDMSVLGGQGMEIVIKGRELDTLREVAADVAALLENTEGATEVNIAGEEGMQEIRIAVEKEKAMENGLTVVQVFSQVRELLEHEKTVTTLTEAGRDYPVIVAEGPGDTAGRTEIGELALTARGKDGEDKEVRLGDIAAISETTGLSAISRDAQERYLSVTAQIESGYNIGLVSRDFAGKLKELQLPEGYKAEIKGEMEIISEALQDLVYMLILAVVLIYLIMVAQFQSLLSPFIVMFTIPLALTGGIIALAITGNDISIIAMLGFLVLCGVVVNNGIVFIDYTNKLRERGHNVNAALMLAGKTRLRPILMTALTTILGLFTLALGVGTGAEVLQPLAIVTIGGLVYATFLTLLVVPVMYALFNRDSRQKTAEAEV